VPKSCNYGGGICPLFAIEGGAGYCENHAPKRKAEREALQVHYRGPQSRHKQNRLLAFARDGWTCQRCKWRPRCVREFERFPEALSFPPQGVILAEMAAAYKRGANHLCGHHVQDVDSRPDLANELSNLETICFECHSKETGSRRS
jgi:5-methylcytosine-specific restriction endonuclease McrA